MRPRLLFSFLPALVLAALPTVSSAGIFVGVSVNIAPPPLPVYVQPACPEAGYLWVPGYWAWGPYGYYWVPGTWVLPPQVGLLWTPGWWGWNDGAYLWHEGYWGPRVGFYGGIDYGYGYNGVGFVGGYWNRGVFFYNRAVVHVGPTFVRNVYYRQYEHPDVRHVSFNGGRGGIMARPDREDMIAAREHHYGQTPWQERQSRMASDERALRASYNHGRPAIAATARPAEFHGRGVYGARAAGGPMSRQPYTQAPRMRTDRPAWASGQPRNAGESQWRQPRQQDVRPADTGTRGNWSSPRVRTDRPAWADGQGRNAAQPQWRQPRPEEFRPAQPSYHNNWSAPRQQRPQAEWQPQRAPRQWDNSGWHRPEMQPQQRAQPQWHQPQQRGGHESHDRGPDHRR